MCNVLIIEDQQETIDRFRGYAAGMGLTFFSPVEAGLTTTVGRRSWSVATEGGAVEEQLAEFLKETIRNNAIDLVLLDSDLAREPELQSHSSYKAALRDVGMPVCRYQKGGRTVDLAMLPQLQRTIRDGASAIWIPRVFVGTGIEAQAALVPRLKAISAAFKAIETALAAHPDLLQKQHSPTEVLAAVLGDANLSYEFLGYAAQNLAFFARPEEDSEEHLISKTKRYATQLGYWLFNYILMFPGPILNQRAAAAFLNVEPDGAIGCEAFTQLLDDARYQGPFSEVEPYYWRTKLVDLAATAGGDITNHELLRAAELTRVDDDPDAVQAFVCMISGEAITQDKAAPNPDWVPSGASEAKIKEDVLDELGPLAGI